MRSITPSITPSMSIESSSLFPTTLPESMQKNMRNAMPRLPPIRTSPQHSPGPLGATPQQAKHAIINPLYESPPFMNPIAASHAIARNRHLEKARQSGSSIGSWYHRKMALRENKKFKKTYL